MYTRAYWPQGIGNDPRPFLFFLALSTVCHVILFGMFIFVPSFEFKRNSTLSVINVSMVTLPAREKTPEPELQLPTEALQPKITPQKFQTSRALPKTVSVAPKKKIKKDMFLLQYFLLNSIFFSISAVHVIRIQSLSSLIDFRLPWFHPQ